MASQRSPVVAVLGAGTMGAAMATNVAAAGMAQRVWNRDRSAAAPLAEAAAKDAVLITDAARAASLDLGIAEVVRERLQLAVHEGLGRSDVAATYRTLRPTAATR